MAEVVELDTMPTAVGLYARALTPRSRPDVALGLPDRVVRLVGHRSAVADVAAYNAVCGFVLTDRVPATWLHVLTFGLQLQLMTAADFPLGLAGMVHVGNHISQYRPALVTDVLALSVRAENLRPHRRGVLFDIAGEATAGNELVWQGRSTYLNRSATLRSAESHPQGGGSTTDFGGRSAGLSDNLPSLRPAGLWRLPPDLGRRYAAVSGDVNPIHLNPLAARAFGFPRAIAHGMWTHARTLAALQPRLGEAFDVRVDFSKPVLLPSTVRFAAGETQHGYAAQLTDRRAEKVFLTLTTTRR